MGCSSGDAGHHGVLQPLPGAATGRGDEVEHAALLAGRDGALGLLHPTDLLEVVQRAQHRAVAAPLAELCHMGEHRVLARVAEVLDAERLGDGVHLVGDRRVLGGEVRVALAGVHDHKVAPQLVEAEVHPLVADAVGEVQEDRAAHGARHLVHEARRLAPPDVLGVLADARVVSAVDGVVVVEVVDDLADEHLEGGRGAHARGRDDLGGRHRVEAADLEAALDGGLGHMPATSAVEPPPRGTSSIAAVSTTIASG